MSFPYKHVLLIGATSGIGAAMATKLIKEGVKVTAVGRRQDRLERFVQESGSNASYLVFDQSDIAKTPSFAASALKQFPDIDSVFLNAGVQGTYDWSKPENVDLNKFLTEFSINFNAIVALAHAFLPLLEKQPHPTSIIFTSTHLALIPCISLSSYCASKHALNAFVLALRYELEAAKSSVKIIELLPPVVQTELHDYMGPERGRAMGMPVNIFTEQAYKGLCSGDPTISIGGMGMPGTPEAENITGILHDIHPKRQKAFDTLSGVLLAARQAHK